MNDPNRLTKWLLVLGMTALALLSLYPPQRKLKGGIDLVGGTSLLFEIDTSGLDYQLTAMGTLVDMNLIVAGTSPLAADMVATALMGIDPAEVPTFACAHQVGMGPRTLDEIEVRGLRIDQAKRAFVRPSVVPWASINRLWGVKEL